MEATAISLFWILLAAAIAPLVAAAVPHRLLPEVVPLLAFGVVIGPNVLGIAGLDSIDLLRELGLGMLFLLAGYEIELKELTGSGGRRALVTWIACFAIALGLVGVLQLTGTMAAPVAVAIALTSTALGVLLPILKDSRQLDSPLGRSALNHGAFGELCPIIAMAVLLGGRGEVGTLLVLAAFSIAAATIAIVAGRVRSGSGLHTAVLAGSETSAQTTVRLVLLLLVGLGLLAVVFDLDVVLGAFAAGFILRRLLPGGHHSLEHKLEGLAFGLLIPIFFVTSGMAIEPDALAAQPLVLLGFVVAIVIVRGGPVVVSSLLARSGDGDRAFSTSESVRIGLFGATGLPIIVAVTSVAVSSGQMSTEHASLLVAGGAITVFVLPLVASIIGRRAHPRAAIS